MCICFAACEAAQKEYVKPRLAVLSFDTKNVDEATVQALTERVQSRFENSNLYLMVERAKIQQVLQEQAFQLTGTVNDTTAVQVGKILGVSKLVLGSVNRIGGGFEISGRIVDVETGAIEISGSQASMTAMNLQDSVDELVRVLVEKDRREYESCLTSLKGRMAIQLENMGTLFDIPEMAKVITERDYGDPISYSLSMGTEKTNMPPVNLGLSFKYYPLSKTNICIAYFPSIVKKSALFSLYYKLNVNVSAPRLSTMDVNYTQAPVVVGTINHLFYKGRSLQISAGAGIVNSSLKIEKPTSETSVGVGGHDYGYFRGFSIDNATMGDQEQSFTLYTINTGFEYMLQKRVGIGLLGRYIFGQLPIMSLGMKTNTYSYGNGSYGSPETTPVELINTYIRRFSLSFVASFYF